VEHGRGSGSGGRREESRFDSLPAALHPAIERLTRNAQVATELGHNAIVAGMGDHLADDLGALSGSGIMSLNHRVPLKGESMQIHRHYLSGLFCATVCDQTVKLFGPYLNHP